MPPSLSFLDAEIVRRASLHRGVDFVRSLTAALEVTKQGNSAGYYTMFEYENWERPEVNMDIEMFVETPDIDPGTGEKCYYGVLVTCNASHILEIEVYGLPSELPVEFREFNIHAVQDDNKR